MQHIWNHRQRQVTGNSITSASAARDETVEKEGMGREEKSPFKSSANIFLFSGLPNTDFVS